MLTTAALGLYFWALLFTTSLFLAPYGVLVLLGQSSPAYEYAKTVARVWAHHLLWLGRIDVDVHGLENYPRGSRRICVVSNHQGYADILLLEAYLPDIGGFVAKQELKWVPILSTWMRIFHCVFIDRRSIRRGSRAIERAVGYVRRGFPMLIFPEGTRSHSARMGSFKGGSLKLAIDSEATIVPVTIDGTYRVIEQKGRLQPARTTLVIHPPLAPEEYVDARRGELAARLANVISEPLNSRKSPAS